ncbi:hypothetical protein [Nostoc sp.]
MGHGAIQFWILVKQRGEPGANSGFPDLKRLAFAQGVPEASPVRVLGVSTPLALCRRSRPPQWLPMSDCTKPSLARLPLGEGIDDFGLNFNSLI